MQLTKFTHACIRVEAQGRVLVIDPGIWSEPEALAGADAVLVTHEHGDHVDVARLSPLGVAVFAPTGSDLGDLPFTAVTVDDTFEAAGFTVSAVGGQHAPTYAGLPDCVNLGYVIDGTVYHPGDALHVPHQQVDTLCVPLQGAWLKTSEAIDFVKAVAPRRALGIHDAQVNHRGLDSISGWLARTTNHGFAYLAPGDVLER